MRLSVIFLVQTLIVLMCLVAIVVTFMLVTTNSVNHVVKVAVSNELHRLSTEFNLTIAAVEPTLQAARGSSHMFLQEFWRYTAMSYPLNHFNFSVGFMGSTIASQPSWMYLYQTFQMRPVPARRISYLDAATYFANDSLVTPALLKPPENVTWSNFVAAQDGTLQCGNTNNDYVTIPGINVGALGNVSSAAGLETVNFDTTDFEYDVIIRHMRVQHAAAGFWQGPQLFYDTVGQRQRPLATFSLPVSFDATTGFAVDAWCIDVDLRFISEALTKLVLGSKTTIFLVDTRDRKLIATSSQDANDTVAFNTADPTLWQPWQLPRTPYPLLNTAWNEMCKVKASGYDCNGPTYTYPNELPPSVFDAARLGEVVYTTTATDLIASVHIQRPATSLDWLAISITPRDYYLGEFQLASGVLIAVAALAVVICIVLSMVTYVAAVGPLQRMADSMASVARLDSDGGSETGDARAAPALQELQLMHDSFVNLSSAIDSFTRYVPRDVVRSLMAKGELCKLEMEPMRCAMLFIDIEGFTTICEQVPAAVLSPVIQNYFDRMSSLVMRHDGLIDKYIGDCIMAVWGAPFWIDEMDMRAALCGMQLVREAALDPLAGEFRAVGQDLGVRVGVNRGEVLAGNMGSSARMNYTVIGDAVNLAARLESLNKQFGTRCMVSEHVASRLQGVTLRLLGAIAVVGKLKPVKVYEALGMAPDHGSERIGALAEGWDDGDIVFGVNRYSPKHAAATDQAVAELTPSQSLTARSVQAYGVTMQSTRTPLTELLESASKRLSVTAEADANARKYSYAVDLFMAGRFVDAVRQLEGLESDPAAAAAATAAGKAFVGLKNLATAYAVSPPPHFTGVMVATEK